MNQKEYEALEKRIREFSRRCRGVDIYFGIDPAYINAYCFNTGIYPIIIVRYSQLEEMFPKLERIVDAKEAFERAILEACNLKEWPETVVVI